MTTMERLLLSKYQNMIRAIFGIIFIILSSSLPCAHGQALFNRMNSDTRITEFVALIKSIKWESNLAVSGPFVVFAPSNAAYNLVKTTVNGMTNAEKEAFLEAHYITACRIEKSPCRTTDFTALKAISTQPKIAPNAGPQEFRNVIIFHQDKYWFQQGSTNIYAGGVVTVADQIDGATSYNIINQVAGVPATAAHPTFLDVLKSLNTYSISYELWNKLNTEFLKSTSSYRQNLITFAFTVPLYGTIFIPDNAAWNKLGTKLTDIRNNNTLLEQVLRAHYLPNQFGLAINTATTTFTFKSGFPTEANNLANLGDTIIERTGNSYIAKNGNINSKIVKMNVPFKNGIIQFIDSPLYAYQTVTSILTSGYPKFLKFINGDSALKATLTMKYTFLAITDAAMDKLTAQVGSNMVADYIKLLIIPKTLTLSTSTVSSNVESTFGNVGEVRSRILIVNSASTTTFIEGRLKGSNGWTVSKLQSQTFGQDGSVYAMDTFLGTTAQTCNDFFTSAASIGLPSLTTYKSLVASSKINLDTGSPYTIIAPTDAGLSKMKDDKTTDGAKFYASASSMKLILQDMIIASFVNMDSLKMNTATRAANMNYAPTKAVINLNRKTATSVTASKGSANVVINLMSGGYACKTSNKRNNLVYVAPAVLYNKGEDTSKCIEPSCYSSGIIRHPSILTVILLVVVKLLYDTQF